MRSSYPSTRRLQHENHEATGLRKTRMSCSTRNSITCLLALTRSFFFHLHTSLTTTTSFTMKNTILSFFLVGMHTRLGSGMPQHVLAGTDNSLSRHPQQLSVTINIAYSPFYDSSAGHCVTEDFGCEQGYCWRKVSSVSYC